MTKTPYEELSIKMEELVKLHDPVRNEVNRRVFHAAWVDTLAENGWEYDEFAAALAKRIRDRNRGL